MMIFKKLETMIMFNHRYQTTNQMSIIMDLRVNRSDSMQLDALRTPSSILSRPGLPRRWESIRYKPKLFILDDTSP